MGVACEGLANGSQSGLSTQGGKDQRLCHLGRADRDGAGGPDRCRAERHGQAEPALPSVAGPPGCLLRDGAGAVRPGVLRRGSALPTGGGLHLKGESTALASKSAITKARIRLGVAPLKELYERVARPLAEPGLAGAFYRGLRLVSLDGPTILVPDEPELEQRFGRPSSSRGPGAFPQARLLALMESGTHAIFAAAIGRYDTSEVALAPPLLERLRPGMLCLADRGFVGFDLWQAARAPGADLLWRVRSNQRFPCHRRLPDGSSLSRLRPSSGPRRRERAVVVGLIEYRLDGVPHAESLYRLITSLLDPESAPATELAALYHERWEQESAFAELKVTLPGGQLMLRLRRADLAEQELYALLLVHLALRGLMVEASRQGGCAPDTLSFIHAVRVVRRHLPFHAAFLLALPFGSPSPAPTHD